MDSSIHCSDCDGELLATREHKLARPIDWRGSIPSGPEGGVARTPQTPFEDCEFALDTEAHALCYRSASYPVSRAEFAILTVLLSRAPEWVRSNVLVFDALGTHHRRGSSLARVHVHRIRSKLGPVACCIESRQWRGYRFVPTNVSPLARVVV